jgi:hypothetical protein
MEDVDGVVVSLVVALEDPDAAARFDRGFEDDLPEERLVDEMGAGKSDEVAWRGLPGEPLMSCSRGRPMTSAFRLAKAGGRG